MRNNTLIIVNSTSLLRNAFQCRVLEYNNQSRDEEIHQWLVANRHSFEGVTKILIPARLATEDSTFMGLYVALHIRLTKELDKARFLPIAILSESSREEILSSQLENVADKTALLLFTTATCLISSFEVEDAFLNKDVSPTDECIFREDIVAKLVFKSPDRGHDLANEWGAFRLAKYAGAELTIAKPTSLFFKYKDFLSNNEITPSGDGSSFLVNEDCKALLIDDKASSGWSEALKFILEKRIQGPSKVRSLAAITRLQEALRVKNFSSYDLIFLDLRLLPEEDRTNEVSGTKQFTGAKILEQIKSENRGTQVIIFTASNKAWHIQALMDMGANGYYIKESPEFVLSQSFSIGNYNSLIKSIKHCLGRKYLREVWYYQEKCIKFINIDKSSRPTLYQEFYYRSLSAFEIAFELLNKSTGEDRYLNLAFLTYFQILEDYVKMEENFKELHTGECYVNQTIRVISVTPNGEWEWKLDHQTGGYFIKNNRSYQEVERPQTLAKVSFILAYKFNKDNQYLHSWGKINDVRNTKAAHGGGARGFVSRRNLFDLLKIIELFLTSR